MPKRSLESVGEEGFKFPDKVYKSLLRETIPSAFRKLSSCGKKCVLNKADETRPGKGHPSLSIAAPGRVPMPLPIVVSNELRIAFLTFRDAMISNFKEQLIKGDLPQPAFLFLHVISGEEIYVTYEGMDNIVPLLTDLYLHAAQLRGCTNNTSWKPFS
jgi:hypothetical protein